jgi:aspartyl-tRNA synthetase
MSYQDAMNQYGVDKPDIRFEMKIHEITGLVKGKGFQAFDSAEYIGAISAKACAEYSRKELDALTEFVKKPQIGAKGLIYARYGSDGSFKSSVDKFYSPDDLRKWVAQLNCEKGDLLLALAGDKKKTLSALGELRLEMAGRLGLKNDNIFKPLWVIDFPLLEWDKETNRFYAMHHPFTSPMDEDIAFFESDPGNVRAKAYDLVINGIEIGGGSIRIFNKEIQQKMFRILGFSAEEAEAKFGFLMNAFRYGAPPHGGIAFGFDRWTALFAGENSIRDVIAFPKNNMGRDMMVNAPSIIADSQLAELNIQIVRKAKNTNENDI